MHIQDCTKVIKTIVVKKFRLYFVIHDVLVCVHC